MDTAVCVPFVMSPPGGVPKKYFVSCNGQVTGAALVQYSKIVYIVEYFSTNGTTDTSLGSITWNAGAGAGTITYNAPGSIELTNPPPKGDKVFARVTVEFTPGGGGAKVTKTRDSAKVEFP